MKYSDPFRKTRILNNNRKNLHHSSSMQYISHNIKNFNDSITENININDGKKRGKILNLKKYQNFNFNYPKKKNFSALKLTKNLRLNSCQNNIIYPKIYINKNRNMKNEHNNNIFNYANKKLYNNYLANKLYKDATTHYSLGNQQDTNFLLDKKIKIINDPNLNTYNSQLIEEKSNEEYSSNKNTSAKKLYFKKLIPNDLKLYKNKLFDDSKQETLNKSNHQENTVVDKDKGILTNSKINSSIRKSKISNNSRRSFDEKGYQNLELNGVVTKVMTRLTIDEDSEINKASDEKKVDYHKIMKHPFIQESYGYDFLRNKKNQYIIHENPFDDKDLAYYIHNLIINPNTKKFRNDYLILGQEFNRRKHSNSIDKNYKLLSKNGFLKLQNSVMQNLRRNVKESVANMNRVKVDLDILMKNNIQRFKEHREELINEEL